MKSFFLVVAFCLSAFAFFEEIPENFSIITENLRAFLTNKKIGIVGKLSEKFKISFNLENSTFTLELTNGLDVVLFSIVSCDEVSSIVEKISVSSLCTLIFISEVLCDFDIFWKNSFVNVFLLISQEEPQLYTYFPLQSEGPNLTAVQVEDFFQPEITQLNGCPMWLAAAQNPPQLYVMKNEGKNFQPRGFDALMLNNLAQHLNATLRIIVQNYNERWSAEGEEKALSLVEVGIASFTTTGISPVSTEMVEKFYISTPYGAHSLFWIVPIVRGLSSFEKMIKPLKLEVWIVHAAIFAGLLLIINTLSYKFSKQFLKICGCNHPGIANVAIFFGLPILIKTSHPFIRFLLALLLTYTFMIRTAYESEM